MALRIESVSLSKNQVTTGEVFIIRVTIVTHQFLAMSPHAQLKAYTHRQLTERGAILPTHEDLSAFRHSKLEEKTYLQVETMDTEGG